MSLVEVNLSSCFFLIPAAKRRFNEELNMIISCPNIGAEKQQLCLWLHYANHINSCIVYDSTEWSI